MASLLPIGAGAIGKDGPPTSLKESRSLVRLQMLGHRLSLLGLEMLSLGGALVRALNPLALRLSDCGVAGLEPPPPEPPPPGSPPKNRSTRPAGFGFSYPARDEASLRGLDGPESRRLRRNIQMEMPRADRPITPMAIPIMATTLPGVLHMSSMPTICV